MALESLDGVAVEQQPSAAPLSFAAAMAHCHTPGVSIALIDGGEISDVWCAGVREAGRDEPVTAHTRFQSGSISKSIAAACALRLVADGLLDLDADVNDRLTSWHLPPNGGWQPRITLRQLLSHTAGTTVHGFPGYPAGAPVPTVPELLDGHGNTAPVRVVSLPGVQFSYSGGGYMIMQQLLADVTGTDFATLAADLVLGPVGMADSTYAQPLPPELAGTAATGHRPAFVPVTGRWHTYPEQAAGGLWSTATDLARFFAAVRDSLLGRPGSLLPQPIARQMATAYAANRSYGLGLQLADDDGPAFIGHGGDDQGFQNTALLYLDSGQGIVAMTNSDYGGALLHDVILPAAHDRCGWPTPTTVDSDPAVPGRYISAHGDFTLTESGDTLALSLADQPPVPLHRHAAHWRADALNLDVRFRGDTMILHQPADYTVDIEARLGRG
jgi:CubicO group peptidase (beta-lactamase class C family)